MNEQHRRKVELRKTGRFVADLMAGPARVYTRRVGFFFTVTDHGYCCMMTSRSQGD